MLLRKFTLSALTFAVVLAFTPLVARPQGEASDTQCGAGTVEPGQTKTMPNGATIQNYGRPNEPGIYYWYMPSDGTNPAHLLVNFLDRSRGAVTHPKQGDQITVGDNCRVTVTCDDFKDAQSAPGYELSRGGINIAGDHAVVDVYGSGNDVDFGSDAESSQVNFSGTNNDVDLNGTTQNSVTPTAGQNIHN